jgi:hypothetical protein
MTKDQKRQLRGTCGVCAKFAVEIFTEFSGGYYYERVCDDCWFKAHPFTHSVDRKDRNVMLEAYNIPRYQHVFDVAEYEFYKEGDFTEFDESVREWVTNHWNNLRASLYSRNTLKGVKSV